MGGVEWEAPPNCVLLEPLIAAPTLSLVLPLVVQSSSSLARRSQTFVPHSLRNRTPQPHPLQTLARAFGIVQALVQRWGFEVSLRALLLGLRCGGFRGTGSGVIW